MIRCGGGTGGGEANGGGAIGGVSSMGVPQTHTSNAELDVGWVYCDDVCVGLCLTNPLEISEKSSVGFPDWVRGTLATF